jgi:pimeloyl-ACP methyl ester carboxylesterase
MRPTAYPDPADGATARFLELETGRVRCVEAGAPDAPPLVMLPGWGCSAYTFRKNIAALATAGFRVLVIEPLGLGWSDKPEDQSAYTVPSMARNVLRVLDHLGIELTPMVGQSLGGGIALQIALDSPGRVTRLALWSPIGFGCARIVHLAARLPLALAPVLEPLAGPSLVRVVLRLVYGAGHPPTRRDVEQYHLPVGSPGFVRSQIALLRNVRWDSRPPGEIARLTLPVSIVAGTDDAIVPMRCLADAAMILRDCRLRIVRGAGHAAHETHPAEVNRETLAFLHVPDALPTS